MSNKKVDQNTKDVDEPDNPYSITEQELESRLHLYNYGRKSTQLYAGVLALMEAISFGTALGWSAPLTSQMKEKGLITLTGNDLACMVSMVPLGCVFGTISWSYFMQRVGPKRCLHIQGPFYVGTWCLMIIQTPQIQFAGRFFLGFLGICLTLCGETFLHHTMHYALRRYLAPLFHAAIFCGVLIVNVAGSFFSNDTTNFTIVCAFIPVMYTVMLFFVPEDPVYLYERNIRLAEKSLAWFRGRENIAVDMANIKKDWQTQRMDSDAYRYMLFSKVVVKGLLIVIGLTLFRVTSGYFIFIFYSMRVWNNNRIFVTVIVDSVVVACYLFISRLFWGLYHNTERAAKWEVRKILITSCLMVAIQHTLLSLYLASDHYGWIEGGQISFIPLITVCITIFFYDMGLNYYPSLLIYEYMPIQVYQRANSVSQIFFWLIVFFNTYSYSRFYDVMDSYITFGLLAIISYLGTLYCYFFVIETKGKNLVQIQIAIGGNPIGNRGALHTRTHLDFVPD